MATEVMERRVNGEVVTSPTPDVPHQRVSRRMFTTLHRFAEANNLGEMFYAPLNVALPTGEVLQPDIFLLTPKQAEKALGAKRVKVEPPLIIEIMSEETAVRDTLTKRELYEKNGVREYWIVDASDKSLIQFLLRKKHFVVTELGEGDTVKASVLAGFEANVGELIGS